MNTTRQPNTTRQLGDNPAAPEPFGIQDRASRFDGLDLCGIENADLARLRSLEDPGEPRFAALGLPRQTGCCGGDDPVALCLAPGEWLLIGTQLERATGPAAEPASEALAERLQRQLASGLTAVYDQSDGLAGIRVSGPAAPWLLAKLSCIDYAAAGDGWCARTRMGDAAVTVYCPPVDGSGQIAPRFDLYVDRSVADALWALLEASAAHATELQQEFGVFA
jgi:heterotetrameric sarcosine oxidase gamma subunit